MALHVDWMANEVSRDALSAMTRGALGGNQTVYRVSIDAEQETLGVAEGGAEPQPADAVTSGEEDLLEDTASRSVELIKDLIVGLSPDELPRLVAGLLRAMGYRTRISPKGPDRGKDIVASRDGLGFEDPRIVVEVKHRRGNQMGAPEIRSFVGGLHPDERGLYVSTGGFSKEARYEAERANVLITIMGLDELVEIIVEYYKKMDVETRTLLPLRRIYWPVN